MSDAIVVGSGPNGLSAAAIALARAGISVRVLEAADTVGGGARSAELTLPGFVHDVCSAIHPLGVASPFFRTLPLAEHGVEWIEPPAALAHPFDDGTAALLERSPDADMPTLGEDEAPLAATLRTAGPRRRCATRGRPRAGARSRASGRAGPLRHARGASGDDARPALVSRREGTRPLRGPRGPLDAAARSPAERRLRA